MSLSRRNFLKKGGIVTSVGLIFPTLTTVEAKGIAPFASSHLKTQNLGIEFDKTDQTIFNYVTQFCEEFYLQGGCILGKLLKSGVKSTYILSKINDFSSLKNFLFKKGVVPLSNVYSRANIINFYYGETYFTLENLPPEVFSYRVLDHSTVQDISYAHQALLYDPIKHKLWDPLKAIDIQNKNHQSLNLIQIKSNLSHGFRDLIQGELDICYYRLAPSSEFIDYKDQILKKSSLPPNLSKNVISTFINHISILTKYLSEDAFLQYVNSPIVSFSIETELKLKTEQVVDAYKELSKNLDGKYSKGSIWLALLFSPKINEKSQDIQQRIVDHNINFANFWSQYDNRFNFIQSQDDFAMSRAIVANSVFHSILEEQLT
ncbi:MAG: hypothetical protein K1X66_03575 [Verrucomicrobiae bacterium]|nr:hypothetical protein [Verrucomicrobiae bacterium]